MKIMLALAAATLAVTGASAQNNAMSAKLAMSAAKTKSMPAAKAAPASGSAKMATHTTPSGKKITYDCSKKGNMNKAACKK